MTMVDLERLLPQLKEADTDIEKVFILDREPKVQSYLATHPLLRAFLGGLSPECEAIVKLLITIGQEHLLETQEVEKLRQLISVLIDFENEFRGGILAYHRFILKLLQAKKAPLTVQLSPPQGVDFRRDCLDRQKMVVQGLLAHASLAEFYPVGGAADRLNHRDPVTQQLLPAAPLDFLGKSLIEGLLQDLTAREQLFEKLTGKRIQLPIVLMTSHEKNNDAIVKDIFEQRDYFQRSKDKVIFLVQPSYPVFDEAGRWCIDHTGTLILKPGGHGALWALAQKHKIFDWLKGFGIQSILARQINNPLGGLDWNLLGLVGYGRVHKKAFGFLSCERRHQMSEGMIVVKHRERQMTLSNIEYCDIPHYHLVDETAFPANTNILYANLEAVQHAAIHYPYPGPLINFKQHQARLETTMQNIADAFMEEEKDEEKLQTFVLKAERNTTISVVKNEAKEKKDTAKSAFFDLLLANIALLRRCNFVVENLTFDAYEKGQVEALFLYHPAFGPLYSLIEQKLQHGRFGFGSELRLDIADCLLHRLNLDGSLIIEAKDLSRGFCLLEGVSVTNRGLSDWKNPRLWSGDCTRDEMCHITLEAGAALIAQEVSLNGPLVIHVPKDKTFILANDERGGIIIHESASHPRLHYKLIENREINICKTL